MNFYTFIKSFVDCIIYLESFFILQDKHPHERHVLILRKDGLGDCLIFYPTLQSYREFYKDAKITLIFPSIFKSLEPLLFDVDEIIWFDHKAFRHSFSYRRKFMLNLKRHGYDVALYPVYSQEKIGKRMLQMTRAKHQITFDSIHTNEISELRRNIDFARQVTGKEINLTFPTISTEHLSDEHFLEIQKKFNLANNQYVIIFPGTSVALYRRWPIERFAEIVEMILQNGLTPVLCGSSSEKDLVQGILNRLSGNSKMKVINLAGMTDFADIAHLLQNSKFYFGSDTGILHLAIGLGIPSIAIVGIGGLKRFFPYGDLRKNRAVFEKDLDKASGLGSWDSAESLMKGEIHPSISSITVDQVRKEVDYMLDFLKLKKYEKSD